MAAADTNASPSANDVSARSTTNAHEEMQATSAPNALSLGRIVTVRNLGISQLMYTMNATRLTGGSALAKSGFHCTRLKGDLIKFVSLILVETLCWIVIHRLGRR